MSLRVWLPLDGDLHNQGASNLQFSYSGTNFSIDSNGKIGSCYKRTARAADAIISDKTINLGSHQSMFCWIKMDAFNSSSNLTGILGQHRHPTNTGMGITLKYKSATTGQLSVNTGTGSARTYVTYLGSTTLTTNTWYHVGYTYDGATIKLYVNGIEDGSHAFSGMSCPSEYIQIGNWAFNSSTLTTTTIANYCALGSINDVRIYDHCLSAAEVHEIAQGLALHYKLDGGVFGNPNLVLGSNTAATSTNKWAGHSATGGNTSAIVYDGDTPCVKVTRDNVAQSSWDYLSYDRLLHSQIKTNTSYTITFDCKPDVDGSIGFTGFVNGNATNYLTASTTNVQNNCYANKWNHMVYKCVTKSSFDGLTIGGQVVYFSRSTSLRAVNVNVLFKNIKVEEGDVETPWCPADSELAIDRTVVEDSSGYNHNGIIVDNPTISSSSSRYSTYTSFNGSSDAINAGLDFEVEKAQNFTFCAWIYSDRWNTGVNDYFLSSQESGGFLIRTLSSNTIRVRVNAFTAADYSANSYIDADATLASIGVTTTGWHFVAGVYTTSNLKLYVDGVLRTTNTITTYGLHFNGSTNLFLGAECAGSKPTTFCKCGLSDVRIYYTALTADDILALYHTGAKVDNLGRFHSYELLENTGFKIHKTGVASHKLFIEPGHLNNITSVSYKPAANTNNSCVAGAIVDFTQFAQSGLPLNIVAEYDVSWSNLTVGTGGNLAVTIQGSNREIASNSWKWSGANYVTQGGITISAASGTTHVKKTSTIPASWLDTYNGSYLGIRCNYSNGNGTISLTNIKVTIEQNKCKVKKEYIEADEFIEL